MLEELENTVELHSISVRYRGETVLEGAWSPFSLNDPQMMHSLSKIGTSICLGFAVDEGKLHLEDHLLDYVRDELPEAYDEALEDITIYDLLTMQAGSKGMLQQCMVFKDRERLGDKLAETAKDS